MPDVRNTAANRAERRYRTYGSLAYQPELERDNALRQPAVRTAQRTQRRPEIERRPRIQPRERVAARPQVRVRAQDAVAPFSVAGFAAVLVCALLLVMATAQLAAVNNDIVTLRSEMSGLQEEERQLQAQYEVAFDLEAIEAEFEGDGSMVRPGAGQTVYLDMGGGDSVVYYEGAGTGLSAFLQRAEDALSSLLPW